MIRTDDCICAIPAKPPVEHPEMCPVRRRHDGCCTHCGLRLDRRGPRDCSVCSRSEAELRGPLEGKPAPSEAALAAAAAFLPKGRDDVWLNGLAVAFDAFASAEM